MLKEFLSVIPGEAKDLILCQKKKNNGKFSKIFFNVFNINFLLFFINKVGSTRRKFNRKSIYNDSERPLINEPKDFEETAPFNENLSNIETIDDACAANNVKTLESPYWSLDIDLKKGEIVKTTLKNYPVEIDSEGKKFCLINVVLKNILIRVVLNF